ncbi:MAG: hypothetical protein U9Q69_05920 [Nanoarchaeota archaeon]|nr:hypothetical protein [Nanoarchaeota archaeon]
MPIVGFNFDKLYVEKLKKIEPPLRINTNVKIEDIFEEKNDFSSKSTMTLRIPFFFSLDYDPKLAKLEITGHIHFLEKKKKAEEIKNKWKKDQKIKGELSKGVLNTILLKCNIKALEIAQDVNLPPHIRLPLLQAKK